MLLQCKPLLVTVVIIKSFQFYPEYLLQVKSYQPDFDYRQGEWVKVLHGGKPHIGLTLDINKSDKVTCVKCLVSSQGKHWKLDFDRN